MKVTTWKNCYDAQWSGIVPEAYAHPAKYSPGLIQKIYAYGLEQGWFKPGDVVADCFGGIGGGGIFAAYARLKWVGVELEARFVDLAIRNFDLHRATWQAHGYPEPVILQGDSRRFSEIIGQCDAITTSPPFVDNLAPHGEIAFKEITGNLHRKRSHKSPSEIEQSYGQTPGQIGNLKAGELASIITSPPFGEANTGGGIAINGYRGNHMDKQGKNQPDKVGPRCGYMRDVHGNNPANIGNLKAGQKDGDTRRHSPHGNGKIPFEYSKSNDQIGNKNAETYWTAMRQVYAECHKALKPRGYLIVVLKSYIKNKRKVPLPQQTLKLLISLGFHPIERIKVMLVKQSVNRGLFGEDVVTEKSRKSFFRRLAERNGSPRIDWEEVLVLRK